MLLPPVPTDPPPTELAMRTPLAAPDPPSPIPVPALKTEFPPVPAAEPPTELATSPLEEALPPIAIPLPPERNPDPPVPDDAPPTAVLLPPKPAGRVRPGMLIPPGKNEPELEPEFEPDPTDPEPEFPLEPPAAHGLHALDPAWPITIRATKVAKTTSCLVIFDYRVCLLPTLKG